MPTNIMSGFAGLHETRLADIAASIGGSLAGDWFEDYIGSAAMAVAAGIVIAQVRADSSPQPGSSVNTDSPPQRFHAAHVRPDTRSFSMSQMPNHAMSGTCRSLVCPGFSQVKLVVVRACCCFVRRTRRCRTRRDGTPWSA